MKIRISEEVFDSLDHQGDSVEDELDSDWEEISDLEENQANENATDTQVSSPNFDLNEQNLGKEIKEMEELGRKLGVDLTGKESLVKEAVIEDQADAGFQ